MSILNINAEIVWVFINLAVLLVLMKHFLFGPVTRMLDQRSKEIADTIQDAENRLDEANQTKQTYESNLQNAKKEAQQIIEQAKKQAQAEYEARMEQARQDIDRLKQAARQQAAADRDALLQQTRQEIAMLSLMAASRVCAQRLDSQSDEALVGAFLQEVEERK